jgi:hypothetical protein
MGRPRVVTVLAMAALPTLWGCVVHVRGMVWVEPAGLRPQERGAPAEPRLVGVQTEGGQRIELDTAPAPRFAGDTLYAAVGGSSVAIVRGVIRELQVVQRGRPALWAKTADPRRARDELVSRLFRAVDPRAAGKVRFDRGTLRYVSADSVIGTVGGAPFRLPLADVDRFEVLRENTAASLGLSVLGIGMPLVLLLAAIIGPNLSWFGPPSP